VTPHLAVANISLFALLKQRRTEVSSAAEAKHQPRRGVCGQGLAGVAATVPVPVQLPHPFGQSGQQRRISWPVLGFWWAADDFGQQYAVRSDNSLIGAGRRDMNGICG
jgi:hypothetical protein